MKTVKRYDYEPKGMSEHIHGDYIEYTDYEELEAEVKKLTTWLDLSENDFARHRRMYKELEAEFFALKKAP